MEKQTEHKPTTQPKIKLPEYAPPTPRELARRESLVERILQRRPQIGPIGVSIDELIADVGSEEGESQNG